ncbi:hypothetical protein CH379_017980 [Leptospira ellisii]|uniref:Uncharacterized protein n=1 Tax=Leptospira ellisii TaxID=2023197 RepID=A0A2N0BP14_9LEPT|nr:hypothetical protein [Leptospira ellisii]MDV6237525.1 hypothetical protein [Leptospira ellisii]PJZ92214.1 hypothetical protein CH379_14385 [Leptospira ellisii]PKA05715.1 hypothetical protein CH375_03600 [Leptospira ellisii]
MGKGWSVEDKELKERLGRVFPEKILEVAKKALEIVALGIPAKVASSKTGIQPQRQTGYMLGAYSIYVGDKLIKDEEEITPNKGQFKLPPMIADIEELEAKTIYEAPYAEAQQSGEIKVKGKVVELKGKQPGTGPGWIEKLQEPVNANDIVEEVADHFHDLFEEKFK